jgi:NAD+ kinase
MRKPTSPPKRIAVAYHSELAGADQEAFQVAAELERLGTPPLLCASNFNEELRLQVQDGQFDALVVLGGDGTLLRTGRLCAPSGTPILGINLGRFGFLIEVQRNNWQSVLTRLLEGDFWLEDRMMLHAELWRDKKQVGAWDVLNEVVICRGQYVRPIQISASVDGALLSTFIADGLIAATATGSTAYAMAAGGPIMPPELRNILVMPVAPHLSMDRGILLPEGAFIKMTVHTDHEAVLSVDGSLPIAMFQEDSVMTGAGEHTVSFIRFQDPGYFYRNLTRYMERNPVAGKIA